MKGRFGDGSLVAGEAAKFTQVGDQRVGQHRTDTLERGEALEQRLLGTISHNNLAQCRSDFPQFRPEVLQTQLQAGCEPGIRSRRSWLASSTISSLRLRR